MVLSSIAPVNIACSMNELDISDELSCAKGSVRMYSSSPLSMIGSRPLKKEETLLSHANTPIPPNHCNNRLKDTPILSPVTLAAQLCSARMFPWTLRMDDNFVENSVPFLSLSKNVSSKLYSNRDSMNNDIMYF